MAKRIYKVKKGQTLSEIATYFKTSEHNIRQYNNLGNEAVYEGLRLIIDEQNFISHTVRPFENFNSIAKKYKITQEKLREINKSEECFIGQIIYIPCD